jgi:hypothetical protein
MAGRIRRRPFVALRVTAWRGFRISFGKLVRHRSPDRADGLVAGGLRSPAVRGQETRAQPRDSELIRKLLSAVTLSAAKGLSRSGKLWKRQRFFSRFGGIRMTDFWKWVPVSVPIISPRVHLARGRQTLVRSRSCRAWSLTVPSDHNRRIPPRDMSCREHDGRRASSEDLSRPSSREAF